MDEKKIRKLKRADLLAMLIDQNREVKRLKLERDSLIAEIRYFKQEFEKVGSLEAILRGLNVPVKGGKAESSMTAIDELLFLFENEESTLDLFDLPDEDEEEIEENLKKYGDKKSQSEKSS